MSDVARTSFAARGGPWVLAQFALMLAVIVLGVAFHSDWSNQAWIVGGVVLFAVGGWVGVAGVISLGRNRTAFPRPLAEATLVQHGIYARVRHPLYTSVMLATLGWAGLWQSWPALLAALALIPLLVAKARREELWLRERFPGYAEYARRVPRFFPRFRQPAGNHL